MKRQIFQKINQVKCFVKYRSGKIYNIPLHKIQIQKNFISCPPNHNKFLRKLHFWQGHGYCESKIILDRNLNLIDGYTSYLIYKNYLSDSGRDLKVPVMFENDFGTKT